MSLGKRLEWLEVLAGGKANPSQITRTMEISARLRHLLDELDPFAGRFEAVRRRYMELTAL